MGKRFKEAQRIVKQHLSLCRALHGDPRTPRVSRWLLWAALGYALLPVDLLPDFIPVLGALDDLVIVPLLVFLAIRMIPRDVYREHRDRIVKEEGEFNPDRSA
jgi:uncharacterized membrane protein YkvA (DUF1232 family)